MENYNVAITQQAGIIQCDFESAKSYLESRMQEYQNLVFTEETKASAKGTVAELRKEKRAFSDRVKEVKEEYMKPFDRFVEQANQLIEMYDQPINYINAQISEFERKRIDEKRKYIKRLYEEYIGEMSEILPLARISNPRWENATTSRKAICAEISERRDAARTALKSIRNMHSDAEDKAISIYKDTLDLSKAMLYISQYESQKAEIQRREQERVRREEEERIRREEREKIEAEQRAKEAERLAQEEKEEALRRVEEEKAAAIEAAREEAAQEVIDSLVAQGDGETSLYEYRLSLSLEQKEKLEMYLDSVGIEWEEIL